MGLSGKSEEKNTHNIHHGDIRSNGSKIFIVGVGSMRGDLEFRYACINPLL
jgi:hypothetical protein